MLTAETVFIVVGSPKFICKFHSGFTVIENKRSRHIFLLLTSCLLLWISEQSAAGKGSTAHVSWLGWNRLSDAAPEDSLGGVFPPTIGSLRPCLSSYISKMPLPSKPGFIKLKPKRGKPSLTG